MTISREVANRGLQEEKNKMWKNKKSRWFQENKFVEKSYDNCIFLFPFQPRVSQWVGTWHNCSVPTLLVDVISCLMVQTISLNDQ